MFHDAGRDLCSTRALNDLARFVAAATGSEKGNSHRELMSRLSVALCRGNYRLLSAWRGDNSGCEIWLDLH